MENNQRVNEAIERVFAKLFAMTQEELDARLAKQEMGPIGRVFLDRANNDELPDDKIASGLVRAPHQFKSLSAGISLNLFSLNSPVDDI